MAMTEKKHRFVSEYMVDLNAAQAAIRSGYSARSAYTLGSRLLHDPDVAKAIEEAIEQRAKGLRLTAQSVLDELGKLGYSNSMNYMTILPDGNAVTDLSRMTREQAAAISEFTVEEFVEGKGKDARTVKRTKVKLADKRAALVDIGRHLGIFKDKVDVEHSGNVGITVVLNGDEANL